MAVLRILGTMKTATVHVTPGRSAQEVSAPMPSHLITSRFLRKLTPQEGGCWLWPTVSSHGYGRIATGKGRREYAHRWMYEHLVGPIPEDLTIDHLCRVRACVNPDHLEAVPHRVNILRGCSPSLAGFRKGTCGRGHPKTAENMYMRKDRPGKWNCRACARIIDVRQRHRATIEKARRRMTGEP